MAAKLLHSLTDDNPDLQKQIGCMTGMFQIFDRHHIVTGRRITNKRPPPGNLQFKNGNLVMESNNVNNRYTETDMSLPKSANEKQRVSIESSRASFSSSCSSMSSLDCNKPTQPDTSSFDRIIFPETPMRDPVTNKPSSSNHLGQKSLDLRDVVKDSMHREARGLSRKTATKEELMDHGMKHRDSPGPFQPSKSVYESYGVGISGKQNAPIDLQESLRVLVKLREAPWYLNEPRELPRSSSCKERGGSFLSASNDAPRFSYDGKERNRLSFESRDTFKSTPKLKELPRLSMDSREGSRLGSNSDFKPNYLIKNLQKGSDNLNNQDPDLPQSSGTPNRPPSIVAKLMGLEALPHSASATDSQLGLIKTCSNEDRDPFSRSLKTNDLKRPIIIPTSPRYSLKDPASPWRKNPDSVMRPLSSSRFPIEPAPWRHIDGSRGSQKPAFRPVKVPAKAPNYYSSVYDEIESRLKDLEFKQSGKDLRALKQILEAMQAKEFLENKKEEQASNFGTQREYELKCTIPNQNPRVVSQCNSQNSRVSSMMRGDDFVGTFKSPIVIMKPERLVEKSDVPSSAVTAIDGLSSLHKLQSDGSADAKRGSSNSRTARNQASNGSVRDSAVSSTDKKNNCRNIRSTQSSTRSQPSPKENTTSSVKTSGSVSPRLQQKKLEPEKRSRPPTPPSSDSSKPRRQSNKQLVESGSPGGKLRPKSSHLQPSDDQLSEISNDSKTLSYQGDEASLQAESTIVLNSVIDTEVTSTERATEIKSTQSSSMKAAKKSAEKMNEDGFFAELASASAEQPSPISVLDVSVYRDDAPSPVKQITNALIGDAPQNPNSEHGEDGWSPASNLHCNSMESGLTSEISRKKLQNIEHLVQKLRRLNSSHDESSTDYIASLCENTNPDHRYISEILLASGLLLRDLGSSLTRVQLHPSGHPINPGLFFVLEQTKANTLPSKEECIPEKITHSKSNQEKFHRKLIFDTVNEILLQKLDLECAFPQPWVQPDKLTKKTLSAQKLLKELCWEIEQLQAKKSECILEEEDDGLKSILWEDVMHRSESWTDVPNEISGVVLDVERSIFKELVDEIVLGREVSLRNKPVRRRQLFPK